MITNKDVKFCNRGSVAVAMSVASNSMRDTSRFIHKRFLKPKFACYDYVHQLKRTNMKETVLMLTACLHCIGFRMVPTLNLLYERV